MRVPNLNWPADLYTDVGTPSPEHATMHSTAAAMKPTLWQDTVNTWMGTDGPREPQWHTPSFVS